MFHQREKHYFCQYSLFFHSIFLASLLLHFIICMLIIARVIFMHDECLSHKAGHDHEPIPCFGLRSTTTSCFRLLTRWMFLSWSNFQWCRLVWKLKDKLWSNRVNIFYFRNNYKLLGLTTSTVYILLCMFMQLYVMNAYHMKLFIRACQFQIDIFDSSPTFPKVVFGLPEHAYEI